MMTKSKPGASASLRLAVADDLGTVERNSLSGQAYQQIRKALMVGQFEPGQRLSGRDLATRLGTSLTPVREALLQLVAEGVLESRAGHSITVPTITQADYVELRDLRVEVEGLGAARAAEHATADDIARLDDIHAALALAKAERRFDDGLRWNEAFHLALARASGMPRLVRVVESLWAQSGPFLTFLWRANDPVPDPGSRHGHRLVVDALKAHDPDAARQAIADDIIGGGAHLMARLPR